MIPTGSSAGDPIHPLPPGNAVSAAQAGKYGLQLVLKPHGGGSSASEQILRCLDRVAHANFKVWHHAGNIIYYTGKDPLVEKQENAD